MTGSGGPLAGVTVLELGSFIAGPFAGQLLGDYGADVIKIEPPGAGDPMRRWGVQLEGDSLWWPSIARNKRSVCIDLHSEPGRDLVRRLAAASDIVIENFRPGRLADWALDYATLAPLNPRVVMAHVSGYGQTGPRSGAAGFGSIGEAVGGLRHTTGDPDRPPSRSGISLGDALAGLFAVIGVLAALNDARQSGQGQEVDVAIYEAVAALMESTMADQELGGVTRGRTGSVLPGVAPSNVYPTSEGTSIVIAGNADGVFRRLCAAMDRPELVGDERFATHQSRALNAVALDAVISDWTALRSTDAVLDALREAGVPADRIFTAPDMLTDPHYAARDMVLRAQSYQGWSVPMSGIVPSFTRTPGAVRSTGPRLGEHTREVLAGAGVDSADIDRLHNEGVVHCATAEAAPA